MKAMNKKQLVESLTLAFPGVSKKDMHAVVEILFESVAQSLMRSDAVEIRGFGRLSVRKHSPLRARNPRSGVLVDVPERWTVHFKTSDSLNALVNK